ncbi:hypothetical protein [Cupriavidus sp. SW-Y-13]|uniref:hypothetical protein n=2 Tax=Cupriavidus TaxID=106589 RepID=UPI001365EE85|nr:hypothetical protein [Cupriavidus sp. SW-Y-13]MWL91881.1 hypothetical protein [Cupriavidus sp. SW-Y-13]
MNSKNRIFRAAVLVFGFWWIVFTLLEFGGAPLEVIRNWGYVSYSFGYWIAGSIGGLALGIWLIWFERVQAVNRLFKGMGGNTINGIQSTLGLVPMLAPPSARIDSESKRLPMQSKAVMDWLELAKTNHPQHAAFFLAVWDIYSANKEHPATHRKGGHANRKLWQHCLAVTETAFAESSTWKYDGVYVKKRGKAKILLLSKRNPEYEFDAADPLIPIIALAHDFGKLEAYKIGDDGQIVTLEEGSSTDHDDDRVFHDSLGARMLARLPEYWQLPPRDRRAINFVIGHYHHPSAFPVDSNGFALDDRMSALMEFLIYVDKKTGMQESGRDLLEEDEEVTEEQSESIYKAFVEVITQFGRVNGTGNKSTDASLKIAQKHDGLIVVKELELRRLILAKLGMSLDDGDSRYRVTMSLLYTLGEKGLLYDKHNGIDFSRYHPMHSVSFRSSKNGQHIATWEPVIIFRPLTKTQEFAELGGLPNFGSRMVISKPIYTHNPGIRDAEALRELVRRAFGEDVAHSIYISGRQETKTEARAREQKVETADGKPEGLEPMAPTSLAAVPAESSAALKPSMAEQEPAPAVLSRVITENQSPPAPMEPPTNDVATEHVDADDVPSLEDIAALESEIASPETGGSADEADPFSGLLPSSPDAGSNEGASVFDGDDFADFPAAPEPVASIDISAPGHRMPEGEERPLIADRPGVAIPDKDRQNAMKRRTAEETKEALAAFDNLAPPTFAARTSKRASSREISDDALSNVLALISDNKLPVCGRMNGHAYVLVSDIANVAPTLDVEQLVKARGLPTAEPAAGKKMVGIPE